YREDWFGEPWRKPETAVLIHGNAESSLVWYAWMPRMGQEFRVVRPDLPGLGRSRIPASFEWTLPSLAAFVARVLDKAGVDSAHIIGAKAGGAIAMQFAADYPCPWRIRKSSHERIGAGSLVSCRHRATVRIDDSPAHSRRPPVDHHRQTRAFGRSTRSRCGILG